MAMMNNEQRVAFSRMGHEARRARKTEQDRRIGDHIEYRMALAIIGAVDSLLELLQGDDGSRALVIHHETAWLADPNSRDFRIHQQKHPDSVIGIYRRGVSRDEVFDDIRQIQPLAAVLR